ncbi:unnamed protein product [Penicillium salamii]|uniref:RING-type domain-containing protein n=1 Tax=Penicillium salamii TaxID=1612424 RepID=A0A9W4IIZ5_9EURO|nr:unnamed protein product [Penicillium salamii]CAG8240295.1 unnamed protein product [Penicillium salamii]CAG8287557.1 unnamed protein product [Penicillium salamii]CAG8289340.1 unnamed protein product [Penicillium salamii]CAG8399148.1 unnamed protein product [Penicillium salamii]
MYTYKSLGKESGNMPSLWSFVLAIAGTVLVLSLLLVVIYRLVLRRRRDQFQRRIAAGQVDVEALALNQMRAPRDVVEKMPLYTYLDVNPSSESSVHRKSTSEDETENGSDNKASSPAVKEDAKQDADQDTREDDQPLDDAGLKKPEPAAINPGKQEKDNSTRSKYRLSHTQTTCAICIDDFVAGSSIVRELPCGHIFDSECIDPFLTDNSCLCPLCKTSVLPAGSYCISVTNEMVRREHVSSQSE